MEAEQVVKESVGKILDMKPETIDLSKDLIKDYGADSLDLAEITMDIEDECEVFFTAEEEKNAQSFGALLKMTERALKEKPTA